MNDNKYHIQLDFFLPKRITNVILLIAGTIVGLFFLWQVVWVRFAFPTMHYFMGYAPVLNAGDISTEQIEQAASVFIEHGVRYEIQYATPDYPYVVVSAKNTQLQKAEDFLYLMDDSVWEKTYYEHLNRFWAWPEAVEIG